jgi:glycosyltransferase involved in cell wall biosynthesis
VAPKGLMEKIVFRVGMDKNSRLVRKFSKRCLPQLKNIRPDVIVCVNGANQVRLIKKYLPWAKIAVIGYSGIGYHDEQNLKAGPDAFLAMSKAALAWASERSLPNTNCYFVPGPVNAEAIEKAKPVKLKLKKPIVLSVGALTKYKNVDAVVKAVAKTNYSLLVLGDGEERDGVTSMMRRKLQGRSRWIPHVEYKKLASYYKAADVFCMVPDKQEAFGLVYIEAMAAGLPIVASDDEVRRSIVGEDGVYVGPKDVKGLTKALKEAAGKKPDYKKRLKQFKSDEVAKQMEKVFYEIREKQSF